MYLERIIGTSTKVAALNVLLREPETKFLESELAAKAGSAVSEINRQMPALVKAGIVRMERVGKGKLYQVNNRHFLAHSLKKVFEDLDNIYRKAARKISKFAVCSSKGLKAVILVGSASKGKIRSDLIDSPSDIDIVFIVGRGNEKQPLFSKLVSYINSETAEEYGIICYPVVLSAKEYLDALKDKDRFILEVHTGGVELYGKKPRSFS